MFSGAALSWEDRFCFLLSEKSAWVFRGFFGLVWFSSPSRFYCTGLQINAGLSLLLSLMGIVTLNHPIQKYLPI